MESEKGHVDAQADSKGEEEENQESKMERPMTEVGAKTSEIAGELGPDQETLGDLAGLGLRVVEEGVAGEMALGMDGEEAEAVAAPGSRRASELGRQSHGELKSSREEEEAEELELDQEETDVFLTPDQRGAEGETEEGKVWLETKEFEHVKEKMVGEGEIILEMDEGEAVELAGPGLREEELMEVDHADVQEGTENGDDLHTLIGLDEEEVEETTAQEDVALAEEVPGSDQSETEAGSEENPIESTENQGDELSGLVLGETLEVTGKELDVDQGQATEVPSADERELEEVTLEGDVASAVGQRETEELVGLHEEEIEALPQEELGESALDEGEVEMLVGPDKEGEVIGRGEVKTEIVQDTEVPGMDQKEGDSVTAEEDVASAVGQQEAKTFGGASQEEVEQRTGNEEVLPVVDQGEEPAVAVHHGEAEEVSEDLRGAKGETAEGAVVKEHFVRTSQGEVEETAEEDVAPPQEQGETEKVLGADQREAEKASAVGGVVLGVDQSETEGLIGVSQSKIKEYVTLILEEVATSQRDEELRKVAGKAEELGTGKEDTALAVGHGKAEEVIAEGDVAQAVDQGEAEKLAGALEDIPGRGLPEIRVQSQEERMEGEMKSGLSQEKVEELAGPEQREEKEPVGLDQGEGKELGSAGEERVAPAGGQGEIKVWLEPYLDQAADISDEGEKVFSQDQQDAVESQVPSQEKALVWSPELDEKLSGETQEMAWVGSEEGQKGAKPSQEESAPLAQVGWETPEFSFGQDQVRPALAGTSLRVADEFGKSTSPATASLWSQRTAIPSPEQSQRVKGKVISGLAGLRQGPVLGAQHRGTQSAGVRHGVLKHLAPGLIVTSLTPQVEQRGLMKQDRKELEGGKVEQRGIRSAELGRLGSGVKVGEGVVLTGYRIGREGMSCFSEADNRMARVQQVPVFKETERMPDQGLAEPPKQEQEVRELETLESSIKDLARQCLGDVPLAWLGRPLTQGYTASRPGSGWTAGLGPGHGLALGSLRKEIRERIDMMVVGQGAAESVGPSPESPTPGMGRRVLGLASRSEDVHWLKKVLGSGKAASRLSVTGRGSSSKEGSPGLMAERRSPGLLTGKQALKDWRDGVMGIAIKRYNAMRLAMWGEGPAGLHVKGVKVTGSFDGVPASAIKTGSILERRVLRLAQHVEEENTPVLGVEGLGLTGTLNQDGISRVGTGT